MNIKLLKKYLRLVVNVQFGYLFGSYVNNSQADKSDIDIALFLKDTSLDSTLQINYELKIIHKILYTRRYW